MRYSKALRRLGILAVGVLAPSLAGCASISGFYNNLFGINSNQQVTPDQFVQRRAVNEAPLSAVDKSGTLNVDNPRLTPSLQEPQLAGPVAAPPPPTETSHKDNAISPAVTAGIQTPEARANALVAQAPTGSPATQPAITHESINAIPAETQPIDANSTPAGTNTPGANTPGANTAGATPSQDASTGQYLALGGVVAEVNGTPIFSNKVLRLLGATLQNFARDMGEAQFQNAAHDEIMRQVRELEQNELDYAAAERSLDDSDKNLVNAATTAARRKKVTEAGGSVELARQRAANDPVDFDEQIHDQYRTYMIQLYYQKRFGPRQLVSADDMRQFYKQNIEHFTQHSQASFDLLAVDPAQFQSGSALQDRQLAFTKAKEAHDRALNNANFATLFAEYNNDPGLAAVTNNTGHWEALQRGSFSIPQVEDAIWNLQPGQVTDIITVDNKLYLAKLESRKAGVVRPFDDEDVQNEVKATMERERFEKFHAEELQKLEEKSVITEYPQMIDTTVEMAMQNYHTWTAKK